MSNNKVAAAKIKKNIRTYESHDKQLIPVFTDPSVSARAVCVDGHVLGGKVAVMGRALVFAVEVVAAHDTGEAVVVGQSECLGSLVAGAVLVRWWNSVRLTVTMSEITV